MKKIQTIRINDEIKVLYKKKEKPNIDLYSIHLKAAQEWGRTWYFIVDCIHESINQELEKKYKPIEEKLKNLVHTQTKTLDCKRNFYPRVINKTDLTFTNDELTLLNNTILIINIKNWIKTLALEAETAITQLPIFEQDYIHKEKENNTIKILSNNKYDISILNKSTTTGNRVKQNTPKTK